MRLLREYIREMLAEAQGEPSSLPGDVVDYARELFLANPDDMDETGKLGEDIAQRVIGGVNLNRRQARFPYADLLHDGTYYSVKATTSLEKYPFASAPIYMNTVGTMINGNQAGEGGIKDDPGVVDEDPNTGEKSITLSLGAIAVSIDRGAMGVALVGTLGTASSKEHNPKEIPEDQPHSVVVIQTFGPKEFIFKYNSKTEKFILPPSLKGKGLHGKKPATELFGAPTEKLYGFPTPLEGAGKARTGMKGELEDLWHRMDEEQLYKVVAYANNLLKKAEEE